MKKITVDDLIKVHKITYEEIDKKMLEVTFDYLNNLNNFEAPFYFDVATDIFEKLDNFLKSVKLDTGALLNGIKYKHNPNLDSGIMKIKSGNV